jgi:hypothetical protein
VTVTVTLVAPLHAVMVSTPAPGCDVIAPPVTLAA